MNDERTAAVAAADVAASRRHARAGGTPARQPAGRRRSAVLLALLLAFPALANITSSSLTGTVVIGGAPAQGVTVTVTSPALRHERATTTNARGRYRLEALPPGTYDVTFSLAGHTSLTRRAVLELGRVARADATLEPNPDEDATTSTAVTVSVAETIVPATHFGDRALDRLPYGRFGSASLAPGLAFFPTLVDGVPTGVPGEETIEQMTVVTSAAPVEWETFTGEALALRTRSGGEEFFLTLRDTITDAEDLMHFGEATAGGRIVPRHLWFFAGAWGGEQDFPFASIDDSDGVLAKLDAQLGAAHHLGVSYMDARLQTASARYTAAAGPRFTSEVVAARVEGFNFFTGRASYNLGDHLLTGGYTDQGVFFASDRWSHSRWNVYAGVRHDDELAPRVAVSYDLRGNGAQAIVATWGEYDFDFRVASLGFATAIGNSGSARADVIHREGNGFWQHALHLDARYRLFDRFEAGATYALFNQHTIPGAIVLDHEANVWLGAELPVGAHEFGATLVQQYFEFNERGAAPTDVALRYAIPFSRFGLLLAVDATNVFAVDRVTPRAWRFWLRVRI